MLEDRTRFASFGNASTRVRATKGSVNLLASLHKELSVDPQIACNLAQSVDHADAELGATSALSAIHTCEAGATTCSPTILSGSMSCNVSLTAQYAHLLSRIHELTTFETGGSPKRKTTCGVHV